MLVFLDESGDTGRKTAKGSSHYFVVSIVIFLDDEEAQACDNRIEMLRKELKLQANYEFHFSRNTRRVKLGFLEATSKFNFTVLTVAIDKDPSKLYGEGFNDKKSFYKYACHMVLTNALPYLDNARLVVDKSGGDTFQSELKKYLKKKLATEDGVKIIKIKSNESHQNNLLQLVDYCASISNRVLQNKSDSKEYYKYISPKVISWQTWPK